MVVKVFVTLTKEEHRQALLDYTKTHRPDLLTEDAHDVVVQPDSNGTATISFYSPIPKEYPQE